MNTILPILVDNSTRTLNEFVRETTITAMKINKDTPITICPNTSLTQESSPLAFS